MSTAQLSRISPIATVLPHPPANEVLTPEQWTTLLAIAETVIPDIRPAPAGTKKEGPQLYLTESEYQATLSELRSSVTNPPDDAVLTHFLSESPANSDDFRREFQRTMAVNVRDDARKGVALILSTLNTRVGSLVFNGTTTPFHMHPYATRVALLTGWTNSLLPPVRLVSRALVLLVKSTYIRTSPTISPLLSFPQAPAHGTPGKGYDFSFLTPPATPSPAVVETDVVIVGSGCGAGVVAKNLAEDGHRVLVLEKGYHHKPEQFPMSELAASHHLFHGGGLLPSDDNSTTVIAGSTWGGGGTVNWSASLQPQYQVRREWADQGLDFFTSAEFQACLDRVCGRMGVSTEHVEHNFGNKVLLEGARRLGYNGKAVPQNTGGNKHFCGYCTLGCGSCEKQGPVVSWLPDAMEAGAECMEGLEVHHVIFNETSKAGSRVATGVSGTWTSRDGKTSREVIVKAKKVVISAGTLFSPLILQRSGLKNPQIGQNLHLHPVGFVFGVWPEEIRPWEGGILTSLVSTFEALSPNSFHGAKLETMTMLPSWVLPALRPSGLDYKRLVLKFKHMAGFISLTRDRDSGRIYPDATTGLPRVAYTPSAFDRAHTLEGMLALAKICYVMGATEIHTAVEGVPVFYRTDAGAATSPPDPDALDEGINDARFQAWLATLRQTGLTPPSNNFGSAHQMGTCRMGSSERSSVVDSRGRVWGTHGLYVADASVFPSASGVNPMITNMGISDWISRGLARELRKEKMGVQASL